MISGNRRIPLVYSGEKGKDPVYFKYVPDKLRVIRFGCICPPVITTPVPTEATYYYNFTGNITPGTGFALVISTGTTVRINNIDSSGNNQTLFLTALSTASTITFTSIAAPTTFFNFSVNSAINQGSYWEYSVTLLTSNGLFSPPELVKITYA